MAYRRSALAAVGGFDERFPRAYREDADLALRVMAAGGGLVRGRRLVEHPPGPAGPWTSVRLQRGNADDPLMDALHGRGWRERAGAPRGRRRAHVVTSAAAALAAVAAALGHRRVAAAAGLAWAAATADFAWRRIAPGPRTPREVATMVATSAAIPPAATWHALRGLRGRGRLLDDRVRAPRPRPASAPRPRAVLLDRDGTLVVDVPYNGDPARVRPMPGAAEAVDRLRREGVATAVVSNQSGVARGYIADGQVAAVNRRVEDLLGDLGPWLICPHAPEDGCACRKPRPGLVIRAARALGVAPAECVVIGDIGADVDAARAAGARAVLVPTPRTRAEEVARRAARGARPARRGRAGAGGAAVTHVLVARLDNDGDVLLAGPAVRAVAAGASRVTLLVGPRGRAAAELLPGVDAIVEHRAEWIDPEPDPVVPARTLAFVDGVRSLAIDRAIVLGSFHQSPLPLALLLRLAGVPWIGATSVDYPGSLLDLRHLIDDDVHEVERSLSLVAAAGFPLPAGDDGALRVVPPAGAPLPDLPPGYVVVHPGASVQARSWPADRLAALVEALVAVGAGGRDGRPGRATAHPAGRRAAAARRGGPGRAHDAGRAGPGAGGRAGGGRGQHRSGAPGGRGRLPGGVALRAHRAGGALAAVAGAARDPGDGTCRAPAAARGPARSPATRA